MGLFHENPNGPTLMTRFPHESHFLIQWTNFQWLNLEFIASSPLLEAWKNLLLMFRMKTQVSGITSNNTVETGTLPYQLHGHTHDASGTPLFLWHGAHQLDYTTVLQFPWTCLLS